MDPRLNESVIKATKETFKSLTGDIVQNGTPEKQKISNSPGETSVVISIVGDVTGAITLRCSKTFAASVASKMLGIEIDPDSEDMKDAVGEVLNMIVGATKTYYANGTDPFKLSVPTTIIGEDYTVHIKASSTANVTQIPFTCNDESLHIEVYLS